MCPNTAGPSAQITDNWSLTIITYTLHSKSQNSPAGVCVVCVCVTRVHTLQEQLTSLHSPCAM